MNTRDVVEIIAHCVPEHTSFISSLGRTSEEMFRLFPNQTLFLDSMGDIASLACGVALGLNQDHPVVALDTDGSHMMGISFLFTLGYLQHQLTNLTLIVLDNGLYESGGGGPSRYTQVDWLLLGRAFNLDIEIILNKNDLDKTLRKKNALFQYIVVEIENSNPLSLSEKTLDGIESKYRFVRHLEAISGKKLLIPAVKS